MALSDSGKTSRYTYNAAGRCIIKSHGDLESVYINGATQGISKQKEKKTMKFNLVILVFLIMAISSCCAPKAHNKREKNVTNELSFINNKSINFSIKKVACDTCFPIFDIGYRVRVILTPKQDSIIIRMRRREWLSLLNDETTDYAANILLHYIYNREAIALLYNRSIKDWRDGMKEDDILYWDKTLNYH